MAPSSPTRLWLGPLSLILLIAIIYLFSLFPPQRDKNYGSSYAVEEPYGSVPFRLSGGVLEETSPLDESRLPPGTGPCLHAGLFNASSSLCECHGWWMGERCERAVCFNGGRNLEDGSCRCLKGFAGVHCELRTHCLNGLRNITTGICECLDSFFGRSCEFLCSAGVVVDGVCKCHPGYTGVSCTGCDPNFVGAQPVDCAAPPRKRGAVNSRLTLSGLSFCIITIGLLCVTARRRRVLTNDEEALWYRVFDSRRPQQWRTCTHEAFCPPADSRLGRGAPRATVVTITAVPAGRVASRSPTPPPSYHSIENLASSEDTPPSYDEATRVVETVDETVKEEEEETTPTEDAS